MSAHDDEERTSASLAKGVAATVHGSAFDAVKGREARQPKKLRRRVRKAISARATAFMAWLLPYVYWSYCWLVWRTSRFDDQADSIRRGLDRHGRAVALLWHQEVATVGYGYRGFSPHTLASTGNQGQIVTRILEFCGFHVFRGGSSQKRGRRRQVLTTMIRHMRRQERIAYGITVDGSKGPALVLKPGGPMIARACRAPVYLARTWYAGPRIEAATWDRTTLPLPFNRIRMRVIGPYWIEPDANAEQFARFCDHVQEELRELYHLSYREMQGWPPPEIQALFPPGWEPRWEDGTIGLKLGPHDLQDATWPEWAQMSGQPDRDLERRARRRA
jgi:lysophospholipid acyltransferase (LPLAT)-like uncharacterized protein